MQIADYTPYDNPDLSTQQGDFLALIYAGVTKEEAADVIGKDLAAIERSFADDDLGLNGRVRQAQAASRNDRLLYLISGKSGAGPAVKEWFAQTDAGVDGIEFEVVEV